VKSAYPVDRLVESAEATVLSEPSPDGAVHGGYRRNKHQHLPCFGWVLEDFAPVKTAWLSYIEPGGYIRKHKDAGPWYERWQVPIRPSGTFTIGGVEVDQIAGVPFQVTHWEWHHLQVGDSPRVHLVIDRDIIAHDGTGDFQL